MVGVPYGDPKTNCRPIRVPGVIYTVIRTEISHVSSNRANLERRCSDATLPERKLQREFTGTEDKKGLPIDKFSF